MRERERGGKKGRSGRGGTRGIQVWGKGGKAREGHEETSREVTYSEDVRLEQRVLHDLHREVIVRQTRTKRLAARHCAARVSGLHASDTCRRLTLHTLKKGLVRNPRESLLPGCQLRLLLRCQKSHNPSNHDDARDQLFRIFPSSKTGTRRREHRVVVVVVSLLIQLNPRAQRVYWVFGSACWEADRCDQE